MKQQSAQIGPCLGEYENRSLRQGAAITELAVGLGLGSGDRTAAFKKLIQTAADTVQMARAIIWLISNKELSLICSAANGFGRPEPTVCFKLDALPRYFAAILADKQIAVSDPKYIPVKSDATISEMSGQDTQMPDGKPV